MVFGLDDDGMPDADGQKGHNGNGDACKVHVLFNFLQKYGFSVKYAKIIRLFILIFINMLDNVLLFSCFTNCMLNFFKLYLQMFN